MKIGKIEFDSPVFLAPMAGFTNTNFRKICRNFGAGLVFSEMISASGLIHKNKRTFDLLKIDKEEHPIAIQIFGSNPEIMRDAAKIVEENGADIIDINMGCSVPKIIKQGSGVALMKDLNLAKEIIKKVVKSIKIPVSVKMRKGFYEENAIDLAKIAEKEGVSAITIHGRFAKEKFNSVADWKIIRNVKEKANIPIIGNGDIKTPFDAKKIIEQTNCDAIMVGRACLGNPYLFKEIKHHLEFDEIIPSQSLKDKISLLLFYIKEEIKIKGEKKGIITNRKHIHLFLKGIKGVSRIRGLINKIEKFEEIERILNLLIS